jgi:two-component sensor histidine kinase
MALAEAERRIRAIAVVHEILSRDAGDQVPFDEIIHALVRMAQESSDTPQSVAVRVDGHLGDIVADMATPLAVVLAELLQNAIEHGFVVAPEADPSPAVSPRIDLVFEHTEEEFQVEVRDNGVGLPDDFDLETTRSLGLSIVRDLVRTQLGGVITMSREQGTIVRLRVPTRRQGSGAR